MSEGRYTAASSALCCGAAPAPSLFRHFIAQVRRETASIYGRRMYEIMAYRRDDQPGWDDAEREYAAVWRAQPKYVVSRTLKSVGPNATLISENVEAEIRRLKTDLTGEISITGPQFAYSLTPLIDEYWLYLHPVILGTGKPMFPGPRPPLRLTGSERIGESVIRLTYVPAQWREATCVTLAERLEVAGSRQWRHCKLHAPNPRPSLSLLGRHG